MNENVTVCITPKGDKQVLHFSQFDNERTFTVTVLADDGESAAVLTGLDIEFRIRKTDSHVVTIAPESVSDNVITFKTTEQMCACCGQNIAAVTLMKDDMVVSTLDILVDIQRDILSGGLTSESEIRNLTTQIEQIVPEVVGDNYYDKSEVDDLIAEHTFDPSNYYDKLEVDGLLNDKADSDDVYTKTETDNLLADKADKSAIASLIVQKDVAKAPNASFNTDLNDNLTKCIVDINPVQSGTGTPSPSNPRPISGFANSVISRCGINLAKSDNTDNPQKTYYSYTTETPDKVVGVKNHVSNMFFYVFEAYVVSGNTYRFHYGKYQINGANSNCLIYLYSDVVLGNVLGNFLVPDTGYSWVSNYTGKILIGIYGIGGNGSTFEIDEFMLSDTATAYEPYNGQTVIVNFGQTVYGGVLDVTNGKLTITHKVLSIDNNSALYSSGNSAYLNITDAKIVNEYASAISDKYEYNTWSGATNGDNGYFTLYQNTAWSNARLAFNRNGLSLADFITSLTNNPIQVVYELATPIEITTTPENLTAIVGQNNVYSDTNGDIAVRFTETIGNELGV